MFACRINGKRRVQVKIESKTVRNMKFKTTAGKKQQQNKTQNNNQPNKNPQMPQKKTNQTKKWRSKVISNVIPKTCRRLRGIKEKKIKPGMLSIRGNLRANIPGKRLIL